MGELKKLILPKRKHSGKKLEKVWNEDMNNVKWTAAHLSMEALDHLHRDKGEGREGQETNREDQSQTMDDDNKKKQKEMDAAATAQLEEEQSRALALPKS